MSSGIAQNTQKLLWGKAGGKCSICNTRLHKNGDDGAILTGEMAHIIAKNKGGPRSECLLIGDINGYDNLILLCPNHHTEVDKDEKHYPPERLREIKKDHEARVEQAQPPTNNQSIMITDALNGFMRNFDFIGIPGLINKLPRHFNLQWLDNIEAIHNFYIDCPHCKPFSDSVLEEYFTSFYQSIANLCEYITNLEHEGYYETFISCHCMRLRDYEYWQNRENIENNVDKIAADIYENYLKLLNYIKQQYPEVNFTTYSRM